VRASSVLRIHLCTQSLSLLLVAWLGGFCFPAVLSVSESFSSVSQAGQGSLKSARAVLQGVVSCAGRGPGNLRIRTMIDARIRLIGSLIGGPVMS